ncbi:hypothetical protein [Nonomuraea guangzhouensis]|uniref:HNH endonuclease n=1 Tax=Nonomuraea guangzhouensis TaxID=1291555 RepID=A0ABW4GX38_9ACTN|nr:hypothetical protein [Nonomuraea guangzhouensis]
MSTKTRHNHPNLPYGAMVGPGQCPRCDERRTERAAEGLVDHNHDRLPFGRRKPPGECPRCDELHNGADARPGHQNAAHRGQAEDARRAAEIDRHFASDGHRNGGCGPVCTFGDW